MGVCASISYVAVCNGMSVRSLLEPYCYEAVAILAFLFCCHASSRQAYQGQPAHQNLPHLRPTVRVSQEVAQLLGRGEILRREVPTQQAQTQQFAAERLMYIRVLRSWV